MSLLCAVAGGSGSGKSTLCRLLTDYFGPAVAALLSCDAYYLDQSHKSPHERSLVNYDHPSSLDTELFVTHLGELKAGCSVDMPVYDFSTHSRTPNTVVVPAVPLVFVDGILALHRVELRRLYDLSVFVDAPSAVRLARRAGRDVDERGRSRSDVHRQWQATVEPMFQRFVASGIDHADIVVSGVESFPELDRRQALIGDGPPPGRPSDDLAAVLDSLVKRLSEMLAGQG